MGQIAGVSVPQVMEEISFLDPETLTTTKKKKKTAMPWIGAQGPMKKNVAGAVSNAPWSILSTSPTHRSEALPLEPACASWGRLSKDHLLEAHLGAYRRTDGRQASASDFEETVELVWLTSAIADCRAIVDEPIPQIVDEQVRQRSMEQIFDVPVLQVVEGIDSASRPDHSPGTYLGAYVHRLSMYSASHLEEIVELTRWKIATANH